MQPLIVLTGASGSGKTAISYATEADRSDLLVDIFRFDKIGAQSLEAMVRFGVRRGVAMRDDVGLDGYDRGRARL